MMKRCITILFLAAGVSFFCCGKVESKPLKVFILAGQSNMQGHAKVATFDHMAMDPKTAPILREMRSLDGSPRVCGNVWISAIGIAEEERHGKLTVGYGAKHADPKIGPEFTFGIYMQKLLDEPVLIIKTAWGGKSLHTDFRSPGAGPYTLNDFQKEQCAKRRLDLEEKQAGIDRASGLYYRLMIEHVRNVLKDIHRVYPEYNPMQGYELAGFVWFQGWNDMVDSGAYPDRGKPGGYDRYSSVLAHFIRDVRTDLSSPDMPFVIGVLGVGGPVDAYPPSSQRYKGIHDEFRKAMAAPADLPEFRGNVAVVLTEKYWDAQLGELSAREGKVKAKSRELNRDKSLDREEKTGILEQYRSEVFTSQEQEILRKGISNAAFHYLGSAKIMAQIGKAFAEAMEEALD